MSPPTSRAASGGTDPGTSRTTSSSTASTSMQPQQIKHADSSTTPSPSPALQGHDSHKPPPPFSSALSVPSPRSSVAPSPYPSSREPSPIRLSDRTPSLRSLASVAAVTTTTTTTTTRSRIPGAQHQQLDSNRHQRNSSSPTRPTRKSSTIPSRGSSRSLASAAAPVIPTPSDSDTPMPTPRKPSAPANGAEAPRWPAPRLQPRSPRVAPHTPPPPYSFSAAAAAAPAINVQRATPSPQPASNAAAGSNNSHHHISNTSSLSSTNNNVSADAYTSTGAESDVDDESQMPSGSRTPARGSPSTLETVREISLPNSPRTDCSASLDSVNNRPPSSAETDSQDSTATLRPRPTMPAQSQSGEARSGNVPLDRKRATPAASSTGPSPPRLSRQSSAMSTKQLKGKEELSKNMTVETETVEVMQQNPLLGSAGGVGTHHKTLRNKQSSETIRPKREKRRTTRKLPSVNPLSSEPRPGPSHLINRPKQNRSTKFRQRHQGAPGSVSAGPDSPTLPSSSSSSSSSSGSSDNNHSSSSSNFALRHHRTASPKGRPRFSLMYLLTRVTRTASSKADNFEAKLASAVDEANTSDSEETFVYDSNPPDRDDRHRRFHSRTPSATSMVSQGERVNLRSIYGIIEERPGMASTAKRGNKFLNTLSSNNNNNHSADGFGYFEEDGKGSSGRGKAGSARQGARHHHLGRWGPSNGNGHSPAPDNDPPFLTPALRSKFGGASSSSQGARRSSVGPPTTPRNYRALHNGRRSLIQLSPSTYDLDEAGPADDDRTPLLLHGSVRSARSNRSRRPNSRSHTSIRQLESQSFRQRQSCLNRFAACLVVTMMLFLGITGAIGFMFATSQPMTDIELRAIKNVLASEPELMFDLTLKAHNPNIVVVTVDHADLEVFAKSIHAGTDSEWAQFPMTPAPPDPAVIGILDDPPYDSPDDGSAPNMKLGTISEFDSPLLFEGSFFHHGWSESTGEVRLRAPGNATSGGSTRWGRILENEFDLIIKGVVKYTLPFSSHVKSAAISGRTTVKPNSANDPSLRPNSTTPEA